MRSRTGPLRAAWRKPLSMLVFVPLLGGVGCSRAEFFQSPISLSDGVRGRSWQAPAGLELDSVDPLLDSAKRSAYGFDFAVAPDGLGGVLVFSAATSAGNMNRVPMQRSYDSNGFAEAGPFFGALDSTPSSYTFASVVPGLREGEFVASFTQGGINQVSFRSSRLGSGGGWESARTQVLAVPSVSMSSDFRSGPPMLGVFDPVGRGFFQLISTLATWSWVPYDLGNPQGMGAALSTPTGTDARVIRDSAGRILSLNISVSGLGAAFANPVTGSLTGISETSLSTGTVSGVAAASDEDGGALVVANAGGALKSWTVKDGTIDSTASLVDSAVGTWSAGTRAAVVYLGRQTGSALGSAGKYLAVWVALVGGTSQVRSAIYDIESASWGAIEAVTSEESYSGTPRHIALRLGATPNGNAVLAISHLQAVGASTLTHTWEVQVARYNIDSDWLSLESVSNGCTADYICSHLPAVGVLRSGEAVVIFSDQDTDANYRLRGVEFRK